MVLIVLIRIATGNGSIFACNHRVVVLLSSLTVDVSHLVPYFLQWARITRDTVYSMDVEGVQEIGSYVKWAKFKSIGPYLG